MASSTVAEVLRREGLPRLCCVDLATRQRLRRAVRRHEHAAPRDRVWRTSTSRSSAAIPDGGGWRVHGRSSAVRAPRCPQALSYGWLHTALVDHSRLARTDIFGDEETSTTAASWARAAAWFAGCDVRAHRALTDDGPNYRSGDFAAALAAAGTVHESTRPYRPQTNGKVERFHRTLATEWACARS